MHNVLRKFCTLRTLKNASWQHHELCRAKVFPLFLRESDPKRASRGGDWVICDQKSQQQQKYWGSAKIGEVVAANFIKRNIITSNASCTTYAASVVVCWMHIVFMLVKHKNMLIYMNRHERNCCQQFHS